MSKRKKPGKGSRLRNTETLPATVNFDHETFQQVHMLAQKSGVSLAEQTRQLVEFGLEAVGSYMPVFIKTVPAGV